MPMPFDFWECCKILDEWNIKLSGGVIMAVNFISNCLALFINTNSMSHWNENAPKWFYIFGMFQWCVCGLYIISFYCPLPRLDWAGLLCSMIPSSSLDKIQIFIIISKWSFSLTLTNCNKVLGMFPVCWTFISRSKMSSK